MKHTLFACLLLGVTLGFCIFSSVTVRAETQTVNDAIASSRNAASRDDFQSAAAALQAAKETWAAHERFFGVVLAHEELDEVNIAFADTKVIDGRVYGQMLLQFPEDETVVQHMLAYLDSEQIGYEEER